MTWLLSRAYTTAHLIAACATWSLSQDLRHAVRSTDGFVCFLSVLLVRAHGPALRLGVCFLRFPAVVFAVTPIPAIVSPCNMSGVLMAIRKINICIHAYIASLRLLLLLSMQPSSHRVSLCALYLRTAFVLQRKVVSKHDSHDRCYHSGFGRSGCAAHRPRRRIRPHSGRCATLPPSVYTPELHHCSSHWAG